MKSTTHWSLRFANFLAMTILALIAIPAAAWSFGALYYDGPANGPGGWNLIVAFAWLAIVVSSFKWLRMIKLWPVRVIICCVPVYLGWLAIRPSNDREWKPEFAETGYVKIDGNTLTFHNVRNFAYAEDGSEIPNWETRTHHLENLVGADIVIDAFGGDVMAHPMLTFDFGDEGHVLLSIETRREVGESFSMLGGIYKMFELQYIFGDESDFVRVRTNVRDEPCYIYRFTATADEARELLLDCVASQNHLKDHPKWYNAITHNCTTSYRAQTPVEKRKRFDIRILINGKLDQMLYEEGALVTGDLPFPELREQAFINDDAHANPQAAGFSDAIRQGRVGFTEE